mmetsp:Transcript_37549/g.49481  ORF Transcript_37549/g.49481 Transcript_37549/m.49481 type:complete len:101 (-) Transcript_37549:1280-1582(-)
MVQTAYLLGDVVHFFVENNEATYFQGKNLEGCLLQSNGIVTKMILFQRTGKFHFFVLNCYAKQIDNDVGVMSLEGNLMIDYRTVDFAARLIDNARENQNF